MLYKRIVLVCGTVLLLVLLVEFQGYLYPESLARMVATSAVRAHCRKFQMDPNLLVERSHESRWGTWCFDWTYTGSPKGVIGVCLHCDGSKEFYGEQLDSD